MDFDLKALMLQFLEMEKEAVCEQLHDYCTALVVVITPAGRYVDEVSFSGEEEKIAAYAAVVAKAKARKATIIITVNAARKGNAPLTDDDLDGYWWGKLAADGARDCISITASGPGMKSIALDLDYDIVDGEVLFDSVADFGDTEIGMLPDWPGAAGQYT
jgi:hypothetical protein